MCCTCMYMWLALGQKTQCNCAVWSNSFASFTAYIEPKLTYSDYMYTTVQYYNTNFLATKYCCVVFESPSLCQSSSLTLVLVCGWVYTIVTIDSSHGCHSRTHHTV